MSQDLTMMPQVSPLPAMRPVSAPATSGMPLQPSNADFSRLLQEQLESARIQSTPVASPAPATLEHVMSSYPAAPVAVAPQAGGTTLPSVAAASGPAPSSAPVSVPAPVSAAPEPAAAPVSIPVPTAAQAPVAAPAAAPTGSAPVVPMPENSPLPSPIHAAAAAKPAPTTYTVQAGDSLSKIAHKLGGGAQHWHQLYESNRSVVGHNPNVIKPGQVLQLPGNWQQAAVPHAAAPVHVSAKPPAAQVAEKPTVVEAPQAPAPAPQAEAPAPQVDAEIPAVDTVNSPMRTAPGTTREAEEAIERISATAPKAGSLVGAPAEASESLDNNVAALRDALRLVPKDSPDYAHFASSVDGYQSAVEAAGRAAGAPAPSATPPSVVGGAALAVPDLGTAPDTYGPSPNADPSGAGAPPVSALPTPAPEAPSAAPAAIAATPAPGQEPQEDMDAPPVGFY